MRILLGVLFPFFVSFVLLISLTSVASADKIEAFGSIVSQQTMTQSGFIPYSHEDIEEMRYGSRMSMWKEKQSYKWDSLSTKTFTINASAYTASADECGNALGITASGVKVTENRTLACPPEYPFGVKIEIEGMGTYTCEDRGGAIKGNHFDIYMETKIEAFAFGRRSLEARVVFNE